MTILYLYQNAVKYRQPEVMPEMVVTQESAGGNVITRFRDNGILLSELAEEVGVHPVHFARAFKAQYGTTPGCYLRTLRIKWAAEQLQTTSHSISEIALASGFADQSHFGRAFKKHFGVSPGAWRRSL